MNSNYNQDYDYFYNAFYPGYNKGAVRRKLSRLFLALCAYTLVSYTVVYLCQFITILTVERDKLLSVLENPYYIFSVQIISMYVIALPVFILICKYGSTRLTDERKVAIEKEKRQGFMSVDELVVLFFISTGVMIFGGMISNIFTDILSGILGHTVENSTAELISKTPVWLVIAVAVIIGPVVEEIIFRKVFIDILGEHGRAYAIIVSAITFGFFHGNFSQVIYATLLGFILGYIYVKSGKIIYSILMHVSINFFGTVPALLVQDSIDRIAGIAEDPENAEITLTLFDDIMNVFGVTIMQYGFAIAGIVLFCYLTVKKKYTISFKREFYIPRNEVFNVTLLNPGVILFAVFTVAQFVLSIL